MWFANTLSHSAFQVGDGLLRCEGAVSLREPRLSVFALGACASGVTSPKTAKTCPGAARLCFLLGVLGFQAVCSSLRPFQVHFRGVRQWSSFLLLHGTVQSFQRHLLKRRSFPRYTVLAPVVNELTTYAWVYFWALDSDPLTCA